MQKELHKRLTSSALMLGGVLFLYGLFIVLPDYWHQYTFTLITLGIVARLGYEWSFLVPALDRRLDHAWWRYVIPSASCGLVAGFVALYHHHQLELIAFLVGALLSSTMLYILYCSLHFQRLIPVSAGQIPLHTRQWDTAVLGIAYSSLAGIGLLAFWMLEQDFVLVFFITLCIIVADSTAYFAGKRWGKRKMCPSISPGKTWVGAVAAFPGVFCFAIVASLFSQGDLFSRSLSPWTNILHTITLLAIVLLSIWGDLLVSILKRRSGIKDVTNLIPGHGGLLDRVDGMVMVFAFLSPIPLWILIKS